MAVTHSPDPATLDSGAGTAAQQTARPRKFADHVDGGYDQLATGATAGTPGTWTPAGSIPAASFTQMDTITASPATAWTVGQHVVLGDASKAYWGGSAWTSGQAPVGQVTATKSTPPAA